MGWELLKLIQVSRDWSITSFTLGQLFRITSSSNAIKRNYLQAVIGQILDESNNLTIFDARRLSFKLEAEAFLFVKPESLTGRKLAVKRLDNLNDAWDIQIEEFVGALNLPIHVNDIVGLESALADKALLNHSHSILQVDELTNELNNKAELIHAHDASQILNLPPPQSLWYPESFVHWHQDSAVVQGGAIVSSNSGNQGFYTFANQNSNAINDAFKFKAHLASGTYVLKLLGSTQPSHGVLSLSINGTLIFDNLDWYSSAAIWNVTKSVTVNIIANGLQEFIFSVKSKHPSSTGHGIKLTKITLQKQ